MQLTLVMPTYNEAENLPRMVSALFDLPIPELKVLVVDDNSPDGTGEIADQLSQIHDHRLSVLHRSGKLGLGSAYQSGFQKALEQGAEAVGQMDMDFSHPPEKLPEMIATLAGTDIVMGSRYVPGGSVDERWPIWRKALSAFGNTYARIILGLPMHDVTGGFRLWRREVMLGMPLDRIRSNGYAFQVELAYVSYRLGYSYHEVPIYFADRRWGISKMSLAIQLEAARRVWQMLWEYGDLKRSPANSSSP